MAPHQERWPQLPYAAWKDTCATLQLWTQIAGKVRLALTPWLNHSWHVTLYVTARGLGTADRGRRPSLSLDFDFIDHVLWLRTSDGHFRQLMLRPMTVAEFYEDVKIALRELGVAVRIMTMPCEIPDCMPFEEDTLHASYDAGYANRFWRVLLAANEVFCAFPHRLSRQDEPRAFLLGQFRSGCDALFRPRRAAPSRRRAASAEFRGAGGLFARSVERRFLAGRRRADRLRRVLFLRLSGAGRLRCGGREAEGRRSSARSSASSCCPTTLCAPRAIPMRR